MELYLKGEHPELLPPGICFICEERPLANHDSIIDTHRDYETPFPTLLMGRKYLCGNCARDYGRKIGLVDADELNEAIEIAQRFKDTIEKLELLIKERTDLADLLSKHASEWLAESKPPQATQATQAPKPKVKAIAGTE